jgi:23S rRNA pseudouridine2605 synthase
MPPVEPAAGERVRLQKVLATAGVGSRRACEEMIADGRVTVDGTVAQLGNRVDPATAVIRVDGERIATDPRKVYLAFNKPRGVVSTMDDDQGRAALADFLGRVETRVFHVGRLDAESEGLLLLTNDGELAHKLTHPRYGVAKTYLCQVPGPVPRRVGRELLSGVELDDGRARAEAFRVVDTSGRAALVELVVREGRKHLVRRMLAQVGHPVDRLVRVAVGPVMLGRLKPGQLRRLTVPEIGALYAEAERS